MVVLTNSEMNQFSYQDWAVYFAKNKRLNIDFSRETPLSEADKSLVFPSIRAFQKGEGSDGSHLMKTVEVFVKKTGEYAYRDAMSWFIKEENWHSAYLKKYMDYYQVKSLNKSFLDRVFRKLRALGGLKGEVTVLVTAEMIALTYYDARAKTTYSPVLKSICEQMLHDELPHIMFQSHTLQYFKNGPAFNFARMIVMEITSFFVWSAFRDVFRAGGYCLSQFLKENRGYLRQSIQLSKK